MGIPIRRIVLTGSLILFLILTYFTCDHFTKRNSVVGVWGVKETPSWNRIAPSKLIIDSNGTYSYRGLTGKWSYFGDKLTLHKLGQVADRVLNFDSSNNTLSDVRPEGSVFRK